MLRTVVRYVFWLTVTVGLMLLAEALGRVLMSLY